jgi:integrase
VTIIDLPAGSCQAEPQAAGTAPNAEASADLARADELDELGDRVRGFVAASKAPATLRAYRTDWTAFTGWCDRHGLDPLPATPETIAAYLTDLAGVLSIATLQRRLSSIAQAHRTAGHEPPTRGEVVRQAWKGIRRTFGVSSTKKAALETADVRAMVGTLGDRLIDARDRAMVLIGFASAMRRGEVTALDVEDLEITGDGLVVTIRRSKTDQEGKGHRLGLPYGSDPATCPVRAYQAWLERSGITASAVFRQVDRHGRWRDGDTVVSDPHEAGRIGGRAYGERVKLLAARIGHDPATIGGHSTRRGFITSAARARVLERDIMRHSRHRSLVVLRGYIEEAGLFDDNAAMAVGL